MGAHGGFRRFLYVIILASTILLGQAAYGTISSLAAPPMQTELIYAVPGTLERATGQAFLTYFVTQGNTKYAIFGTTPEIEDEIARIRDGNPDAVVKVWGELNVQGQQYPGPEIIATAVQEVSVEIATATPRPTATPTPTSAPPVAVGRFDYVNLHETSALNSPVVGQIVLGQRCPVTGRNPNASTLQIRCDGVEGWVANTVVTLQGDTSQIPVAGAGSQVSQIPIVVVEQSLATPVPSPDTWLATFYANRNLLGNPVLVQQASRIEFDWGTGSPGPEVPVDNFSASFERTIDFPAGLYRFCICSLDDGARMWIDDELVLNDWNEGSARDLVVDRQLAGSRRVRIEYFEAAGTASVTFSYQSSTTPRDVWQVSYWNNTTREGPSVMTSEEALTSSTFALDHDWGTGSPAPGVVNADLFSARWEGYIPFAAGSYVFNVQSDDGVRVYVDGTLVIYGWRDGYHEMNSGIYSIGQGQHQVVVEYYERTGNALIRLRWYQDQPLYAQ